MNTLRTVRHASSQALTGADMYQLRVELERRIEERLDVTDSAQDQRIMAAVRALLLDEIDHWAADVLQRVDIRLAASSRLNASLAERVALLERRAVAVNGDGLHRSAAAPPPPIVVRDEVAS